MGIEMDWSSRYACFHGQGAVPQTPSATNHPSSYPWSYAPLSALTGAGSTATVTDTLL